jgi:membrane protease YdiL (CAAX protease family)
MFREPPFRHFSPSLKILALIMLMIITFLVFLAVGVAFSIPFFGRGLLDDIAAVSNYSNPQTVFALKYFQIVNQIGVFIAPAILFVILTDDHFSEYLGFDSGFSKMSIFLGFIVLIVSLPFINWLVDVNNGMHLPAFLAGIEKWMRESEDSAQKLTNVFLATKTWEGLLVNLFMIGGLAAIGEELVFRGILVRLFREWTGNIHLAVLIPALLFSALHLQFYGFFGRALLGLVLGYLFIWSGSLWVPIVVHFLNNAMAVVLSFLISRGLVQTNLESFGSSKNGYIIAGSFIMMVLFMGLVYYYEQWKIKKRPWPEEAPGS